MILLKKDAKKVDWPAIQKRLERMRFENTCAYDPSIGVWLTEDPIGFEAGDPNKKRYVHNDPINFTDRSGLSERNNYDSNKHIPRELGDLDQQISNHVAEMPHTRSPEFKDWDAKYQQLKKQRADFLDNFGKQLDKEAKLNEEKRHQERNRLQELENRRIEKIKDQESNWCYAASEAGLKSVGSIWLGYESIIADITGDPEALKKYQFAYENSPLGQTANSSGGYYYGVRGALGVSIFATTLASGLLAWEAAGLPTMSLNYAKAEVGTATQVGSTGSWGHFTVTVTGRGAPPQFFNAMPLNSMTNFTITRIGAERWAASSTILVSGFPAVFASRLSEFVSSNPDGYTNCFTGAIEIIRRGVFGR